MFLCVPLFLQNCSWRDVSDSGVECLLSRLEGPLKEACCSAKEEAGMFPSSHRLLMTGGEQMSEIGLKNQGVSMGSEVEGWEWKKGKKKCR